MWFGPVLDMDFLEKRLKTDDPALAPSVLEACARNVFQNISATKGESAFVRRRLPRPVAYTDIATVSGDRGERCMQELSPDGHALLSGRGRE